MEARSRWPSIINEKTFADFKRVAEQTGILTKGAGSSATGVLMSPRIIHIPRRQAAGVDA
jgi:hypothetical protein